MNEINPRLLFALNLVDYLSLRGKKPIDMAREMNIPISTVSEWIRANRMPRPATLSKIADYLGIKVDELLSGQKQEPVDYAAEVSFARFPVIGSIAAGYGALAMEEYTGDEEFIPLPELSAPSSEYFVLRVSGDSMYPKLVDGDHVLVRRCSSVDSGRIAVILYNGDSATVKRVRYIKGEDWLDLEPINPEYKVKHIVGADLELCRVLGEVVKLMRTI